MKLIVLKDIKIGKDGDLLLVREDEKMNSVRRNGCGYGYRNDEWFEYDNVNDQYNNHGFRVVRSRKGYNFVDDMGRLLCPYVWFDNVMSFFKKRFDDEKTARGEVKMNGTYYKIDRNGVLYDLDNNKKLPDNQQVNLKKK